MILHPGRPDREVFELEPGHTSLGRGLDNDIVISDASLSRLHARFDVDDDRVTISDPGSKNGIEVDGVRIESRVLSGGEKITCGDAAFRFEMGSEVEGLTYIHDSANDLAHQPIEALLASDGGAEGATRLLLSAIEPKERAREKLQVLLKAAQILSSPAPLDTVLERIVELILQILDVHRAAILLVDPESGKIESRVTRLRGAARSMLVTVSTVRQSHSTSSSKGLLRCFMTSLGTSVFGMPSRCWGRPFAPACAPH